MFQSKKKAEDSNDLVLPAAAAGRDPALEPHLDPSGATASPWVKSRLGKDFRRMVASVTTDKMTYKPGEEVYIRVVLLSAFTNRPYFGQEETPEEAVPVKRPRFSDYEPNCGFLKLKITNGTDEEMFNMALASDTYKTDSVVSCSWKIPTGAKGGTYKAHFYSAEGGGAVNAPPRKFDVMKYEPPKFKKEITFIRKAYREGQLVKALLNAKRAEGSFCDPVKTGLTVTARIDGEEVFRDDNSGKFRLGEDNGRCIVSFRLPDVIKEGQGSLSVAVTEGLTETVSKTLPIILKKLNCVVYPEGGEIAFGCTNGVYCQAWTPAMNPADFLAVLVERDPASRTEKIVLEGIETQHEGRAYFEFVPKSEEADYVLRIIKPPGVTHFVEIPKAKKGWVSLRTVKKQALVHGEKLEVFIESSVAKKVHVGVFKRDRQLIRTTVDLAGAGKPEKLSFALPTSVDGVLRVTAFAEDLSPLAERIVFVEPKEKLTFEIETHKKKALMSSGLF